jgi:DNA-binding LacI/PurR family transcriptional regulator
MNPRQKTSNRITSLEVALRAGVSQSTVSRSFSNDARLTQSTKDRVLEVALELGYQPNAIARSLITRRTNIIGLVTSDLANPFFPHVLEEFTARLHDLGWRVLLFTAGRNENVDDLLSSVLSYQVDGLIIASAGLSSKMAKICVKRGTPVVLFNRYAPDSGASAVSCDNLSGGRLVADLLLEAGHSRIAYIAGREDSSTNRDRERGFSERLAERGMRLFAREPGEYSYESGFRAAKKMLEGSNSPADPMRTRADSARAVSISSVRPDAIFCANDITAMGCLDAARECNLRVPNDLSVVGFDDIPSASWSAYQLTTVRQPVSDMIDLSIRLLLERIEQPALAHVTNFLPGSLVARGSVRGIGYDRKPTENRDELVDV